MADGTVEHERCPVVVAEVKGDPRPRTPTRWPTSAGCHGPMLVAQASGRPRRRSARGRSSRSRQLDELADVAGAPGSAASSPIAVRPLLDRPHRAAPRRRPTDRGRRRSADDALARVARPVGDAARGLPVEPSADGRGDRPGARRAHRRDPGARRRRGQAPAPGLRLLGPPRHRRRRPTRPCSDPAAAVELLHTFALLHDDVMDRSATRRGRPSAHAVAGGRPSRQQAGSATPDWFGASAAVLAGDLAYVWADELFDRTPLPADAVARARAVFTDAPRGGDRRPVPRPRPRRRSTGRRSAGPPRRPAEVGSLHGHPAAAARRRARPADDWHPGGAGAAPPTATRWAWPSSCATTSSASSATRPSPARARSTISARASARCSCSAPSGSPTTRQRQRPRRPASATPTSTRRGADRVREIVGATGALASVEALIAARARPSPSRPSTTCPSPLAAALAELARPGRSAVGA